MMLMLMMMMIIIIININLWSIIINLREHHHQPPRASSSVDVFMAGIIFFNRTQISKAWDEDAIAVDDTASTVVAVDTCV